MEDRGAFTKSFLSAGVDVPDPEENATAEENGDLSALRERTDEITEDIEDAEANITENEEGESEPATLEVREET